MPCWTVSKVKVLSSLLCIASHCIALHCAHRIMLASLILPCLRFSNGLSQDSCPDDIVDLHGDDRYPRPLGWLRKTQSNHNHSSFTDGMFPYPMKARCSRDTAHHHGTWPRPSFHLAEVPHANEVGYFNGSEMIVRCASRTNIWSDPRARHIASKTLQAKR